MRKCRKDWLKDQNYCKERENFEFEDCNDCSFHETKEQFNEWFSRTYNNAGQKDIKNIILDLPEYYDQGLGEVVKSRAHRKQLMKEKKVEEVGNEWNAIDPIRQARLKDRQLQREYQSLDYIAHQMLANNHN